MGFGIDHFDDRLIREYLSVGRPVDWLAYTDDFEKLYDRLDGVRESRDRAEVFRRLLYLRKAGMLPRITLPKPQESRESGAT